MDFGNLPLIEAAVRASFHGSVPLSYDIVNLVADRLKPTFPQLAEPKQIEIAPGAGPSPAEFGPAFLPGAVYSGHVAGLTLSLHPQVIVSRWVKQFGRGERYPRYPALRDALWSAVEAFREASGDKYPGTAIVNMSYVNFLPSSDAESVLKTYFSDQVQVGAMGSARRVRKLEASWSESDDLDVRFAIEQVTARLADSVTEGYRLTTAAGLRLAESLDAKSALEKIHEVLQEFFLVLINDHAKKEWQLNQVPND
ncbi:MAG: hypothetical protein IH986_11460 [Planctomycetes bacterium]|nr:hypothetical protein [Planctomycetota bacterium]